MKTTLAEMPRLHVFEYLLQLHQNMSGLEILRTQPYHRRSNVAAATSASRATTRDGNRKQHKKKAGNRKPHKKKLSEQVLSKFNCDNINYQQINEKKGKKNTRNVVKHTNNVVIQSVNNVEKKKTKVSLKRKLENVQQSEYSGDTVSNKKTTSNFDEGTLQESCVGKSYVDDSCIVNSCVEACVEESCDEQSCDEQLRIEEPSVEEIVNSNITENQEVFSKSSSSVHHMREPRLQKTDSKQVQNVYDSNLRNKWAHHSVNSEACEFPHDPKREKKLRKRERGTHGTEAVKIVTNEFQPHECPPASVGGDDSVFECKLQESIVMKDDSIIVITEDIIIFDGNALRNDVTQENAEILIEEPDIPENKSGIVLWENRMKTMAKQTRGNHNRKGMPRIKENKCRTRKVSYITEPVTCLMYTEGNVSKCNAKNTFILKIHSKNLQNANVALLRQLSPDIDGTQRFIIKGVIHNTLGLNVQAIFSYLDKILNQETDGINMINIVFLKKLLQVADRELILAGLSKEELIILYQLTTKAEDVIAYLEERKSRINSNALFSNALTIHSEISKLINAVEQYNIKREMALSSKASQYQYATAQSFIPIKETPNYESQDFCSLRRKDSFANKISALSVEKHVGTQTLNCINICTQSHIHNRNKWTCREIPSSGEKIFLHLENFRAKSGSDCCFNDLHIIIENEDGSIDEDFFTLPAGTFSPDFLEQGSETVFVNRRACSMSLNNINSSEEFNNAQKCSPSRDIYNSKKTGNVTDGNNRDWVTDFLSPNSELSDNVVIRKNNIDRIKLKKTLNCYKYRKPSLLFKPYIDTNMPKSFSTEIKADNCENLSPSPPSIGSETLDIFKTQEDPSQASSGDIAILTEYFSFVSPKKEVSSSCVGALEEASPLPTVCKLERSNTDKKTKLITSDSTVEVETESCYNTPGVGTRKTVSGSTGSLKNDSSPHMNYDRCNSHTSSDKCGCSYAFSVQLPYLHPSVKSGHPRRKHHSLVSDDIPRNLKVARTGNLRSNKTSKRRKVKKRRTSKK